MSANDIIGSYQSRGFEPSKIDPTLGGNPPPIPIKPPPAVLPPPTGGPAFIEGGMDLRQYAAIQLCVPDSGLDWLDDMIRQARKDRVQDQILNGAMSTGYYFMRDTKGDEWIGQRSRELADAVINGAPPP